MEYVIDRKKWLRGEDQSMMLDDKGKMCCLGQICKQSGVENMLNLDYPDNCESKNVPKFLLDSYGHDSLLAIKAAEINDEYDLTDTEREKLLIELFKKEKISIKFIN